MGIGRDLIQHIFTNYVWYDSISDLLKGRLTCKQIAGIVGGYPDRDNKFWISYFYNIEIEYDVPVGTWLRVLNNFPSIYMRQLILNYNFICSDKIHRMLVDRSQTGLYIDADGVITRVSSYWNHRTLFLNDYLLQGSLLYCPDGTLGDGYHTINGCVHPGPPLLKLG